MDTLIRVVIVFLVACLILTFFVPFLSGILATIVTIIFVLGAIIALMKIGGFYF